jgi:hypothetical protein
MQSREVSYSEFVAIVENGSIDAVTLDGEKKKDSNNGVFPWAITVIWPFGWFYS